MPDERNLYFVDEEACWILTSDGTLVTCVSARALCYYPQRRPIHGLFCTATSQQDIRTDNAYHCQDSDTYLLVLFVSYASTSLNPLPGHGVNKRRMVDIKAIADVAGPDLCAVPCIPCVPCSTMRTMRSLAVTTLLRLSRKAKSSHYEFFVNNLTS